MEHQHHSDSGERAGKKSARVKPAAPDSHPAPAAPANTGAANILNLQRTIGNRRTQQLLQKKQLPAIVQRRPRRRIQRFESHEHQKLGDDATRDAQGQVRTVQLADDYRITYGEMVAMAGDFFKDVEQMRDLAKTVGSGEGTREELEYVRVVRIPHHSDEKVKELTAKFSESTVKAVDKRYYSLATQNRSHFLNPEAGDEKRTTGDKAKNVETERRLEWHLIFPSFVTEKKIMNAAAGYRKNHVQALFEAYYAGVQGKTIDTALAVEAFGAHFLTDSFSGGHLRTARASINEHWNARVPMFNFNLKGLIAQKLSEELEKEVAWGVLSTDAVYHWGALENVTNTLDSKGFITFGDVVSGAVHDYDNHKGVNATIQGEAVRLYGDTQLGTGDEQDQATTAVGAGYQDITMAWEAGKKKADPVVLASQLLQDGVFLAESMIPSPVPDDKLPKEDRKVKWDYNTIDGLLGDSKFQEALKIFCLEKASEFEKAAKGLNDPVAEKAFAKRIIGPLREKPVEMMREVLNWVPSTGGGLFGHNEDDNALDYLEKAKGEGALKTLTVAQKVQIIRQVFSGYTDDEDEAALMEMINANPSDVRAIIDAVGWDNMEDELGDAFADKYPKKRYSR
jgi:hypothetical protein